MAPSSTATHGITHTGSTFGSVVQRVRSSLAKRRERNRIEDELMQMTSRELADLGLSASDIPDVVRGNYRRA